jgi:hypothetical protein
MIHALLTIGSMTVGPVAALAILYWIVGSISRIIDRKAWEREAIRRRIESHSIHGRRG